MSLALTILVFRDEMFGGHPKTLRVNFFSWISILGTRQLLTDDKMNSEVYCQDVLTVMIRDLKENFGEDFSVIHDNPRFDYEFSKKYLEENELAKYFLTIITHLTCRFSKLLRRSLYKE